jgi:hypothetical protein
MKNMKRAYRRHKKHVKFLKRLKQWIKPGEGKYIAPEGNERRWMIIPRTEVIKEAMAGSCYTFLRTTGRPCNCSMCQEDKYKRKPRFKWQKEIEKQIEDEK